MIEKKLFIKPGKISVYVYIIVVLLIVAAGIFNLYVFSPDNLSRNKKVAEQKCIDLCRQELARGTSLTDGPCLSNGIVRGWVCDVAHDPRISWIDDKEENKCSEFGVGENTHFVEVTSECKLIKAN